MKKGTLAKFIKLFADLVTPVNLLILAGLAIILVTGMTSGWDAVDGEDQEIPVAELGDEVNAHPFLITVHDTAWVDDPAPLFGSGETEAMFVARVTVKNATNEPVAANLLTNAVTARIPEIPLEPQPGLFSNMVVDDGSFGRPEVTRVIDGNASRAIQPALVNEYWLLWRLPIDTPREAALTLEFSEHTWRASSLDGGEYWTDRTLTMIHPVTARVGGGLP